MANVATSLPDLTLVGGTLITVDSMGAAPCESLVIHGWLEGSSEPVEFEAVPPLFAYGEQVA